LAALGVGTAFGPAPAAGVIDTTQRQQVLLLSGGRAVSSGAPACVLTEAAVASAVIPTLGR